MYSKRLCVECLTCAQKAVLWLSMAGFSLGSQGYYNDSKWLGPNRYNCKLQRHEDPTDIRLIRQWTCGTHTSKTEKSGKNPMSPALHNQMPPHRRLCQATHRHSQPQQDMVSIGRQSQELGDEREGLGRCIPVHSSHIRPERKCFPQSHAWRDWALKGSVSDSTWETDFPVLCGGEHGE